MNMGWRVFSISRTVRRRLWGQVAGLPNVEFRQSWARINAPISPPLSRKSNVASDDTLKAPYGFGQ